MGRGVRQEFFSTKEVADILGVSVRTVFRRIADGTLPAHQTGRRWRIPRAGVVKALGGPGSELAETLIGRARQSASRERVLSIILEVARDLSLTELARLLEFLDTLQTEDS